VAEGAASRSRSLFERASRVIPGGVNSPVRAFGAVGGVPYFVARAEGPYVWDVDGRRFIDYVQSYGASILGHAHPKVVEAVRAAALDGTTYGAPTEREVVLSEELCRRVPGLEMVRLVSSGTEAAMSALRLARGASGRTVVVKFAGCYHGHADALLAAGGSGVANQGLSGLAGVPPSAVADTVVVPYNAVPAASALDWSAVACVVVEPVAANMGLVAPVPGFLEGLRSACDRSGTLLIFDEVISGFRVGVGGASERFGVRPDLWLFGKVIGGGLPIGAFGGRRDLMCELAPRGPVYQAGTLAGNPLATAAGLAALSELDAGAYAALEGRAGQLAAGLAAALGPGVLVPRVGTLVGVSFGAEPVRDYEGAKASAASGRYPALFHGLLERGVALAPGPYEVMFPSLAHLDAYIDQTVEAAVALSAAAVAAVPGPGRE